MGDKKQFIKSILPKYLYFKKAKKSIAILGTRRGGTTFLADLLSDSQTRVIDQPLEAFKRSFKSKYTLFKKTKLPPKELYQFFNISDEDNFRLKCYFEDFEKGYYNFIDMRFGLFKSRIVYKFTFGGYFAKNLSQLNIALIILFRHPYTQSISCVRNSWSNYYNVYLDSLYFKEKYLSSNKYKEMIRIDKHGTEIEKAILDWYCSNAELLKSWKNTPTIFYENLVKDPEITLDYLESEFDLTIHRNKLDKPSGSSFLSEDILRKNINKNDYKIKHLTAAFENIPNDERKKLQHLFNVLEIDIYNMDSPYPLI
jgi:hypothetical protein